MPKRSSESHIIDKESPLKHAAVAGLFFEEAVTDDSDEISIDEGEWEDVPLNGSVSFTMLQAEPSNTSTTDKKHPRKQHKYQKLKYGLHIASVKIYLAVMKQRLFWTRDERLNRRLKRSIPTLIVKKFKNWKLQSSTAKLNSLRTLILGLIWWFRNHYQINSNGFRQNFNRLQYLIAYFMKGKESSTYKNVLNNQQIYYGVRPEGTDNIDNIRKMARDRKANRDVLSLFFLIVLRNVLSDEIVLSYCFALPLHDYEISCSNVKWQITNGIGNVPNRFDTDLLQPYFWIELRLPDLDKSGIYVIDPIVHLKNEEIISRYAIDEPVHSFQPIVDMKLNLNQKFQYVVNIDCQNGLLSDVSPRYIPNMSYRYFDIKPTTITCKSLNYKSYCYFKDALKRINKGKIETANYPLMKALAMKNWELPKTLKDIKRSDCFILKSLLKPNQTLKRGSQPINVSDRINLFKEPIHWKCDVLLLKCEKHWNQLGKSILPGSEPLRLKKYLPMKNRRRKRPDLYEIRELFSIEQTIQTPKLSTAGIDEYGRPYRITDVDSLKNQHGNIEIYSFGSAPDGFAMLPNKNYMKKLIKRYNRCSQKSKNIKYIDVVSGFDFKQKPGYAVPRVVNILLNSQDHLLAQELIRQDQETRALKTWGCLLEKLRIQNTLNDRYGRET